MRGVVVYGFYLGEGLEVVGFRVEGCSLVGGGGKIPGDEVRREWWRWVGGGMGEYGGN